MALVNDAGMCMKGQNSRPTSPLKSKRGMNGAPPVCQSRKAPPMMARLFFFYPKFRIPDPENKSAKMFG
jgi:hypothetical protein